MWTRKKGVGGGGGQAVVHAIRKEKVDFDAFKALRWIFFLKQMLVRCKVCLWIFFFFLYSWERKMCALLRTLESQK